MTPNHDGTDGSGNVTFRFDGQTVVGNPGDSLAAALTANGFSQFRTTVQGTPRGLFCGMGVCNDCLVVVDGKRSQKACMTHVQPGLVVESQDDRAPGGHTPQPSAATVETSVQTDVLVIGAGPAGLSAAIMCRDNGADVMVVDERDAAGGQYFKPRTAASRHTKAEDAQHRAGNQLRTEAQGLTVLEEQGVWYARPLDNGEFDLRTIGPKTRYRIIAKALIIATGAYELPQIVPGWTLPGVMTIGAGQTLVRRYGVAPGKTTLIAGNGPLGLQLAHEMRGIGAKVAAVVEMADLRAGPALLRAAAASPSLFAKGIGYQAGLWMAGTPILTGWQLAEIRKGSAGLEAHLLQVSGAKSRVISADAICMGGSFAPQVELARLLGCTVKVEDGLPIPDRDAACRTSVPGVWIAGDAGGLGGAQLALAQGRIAGIDVLKTLGKSPRPEPALAGRVAAIKRFQTALWRLYEPSARQGIERRDDLYLCRCESVSSEQVGCAIAGGAHDLGAIKRATRLGMGRCQGRYCTRPALAMLKSSGNTVGAAALMAPQLPARPLPIHDIALEKPEWAGHKETSPSARPAVAVDQPLALDRADLVVIGGGVTGLAATLYAARQGASVICIDRGRLGAEASGGNAGSLHLQLLSWDFGSKAFAGGSAALQTLPLQKQSIDLWGEVEAELGADFEMKVTGGLMVAENPKQIDFLRAKTKAEGSVGITSEVLNGTEIRALMPHISEHIVAGAWCPGEGKINPLPATMALARAARALGAVIEEMAPAIGLSKDGKDYIVQTSRGSVRARKVIIAAGGWSSHPARFLGVDLPIRGAPLQMLVTEPAPPMVPCLLAHADRHLSMKQAASGSILIGGAWTATTSKAGQTQVLADSIEGSLWVAAHTVPAVGGLSLVRSWAAMTIDIDGAPLLSQLPGHPDVVVAATSNGFTLGPLMGREAATLALKGVVGTGLSQFNLDRF